MISSENAFFVHYTGFVTKYVFPHSTIRVTLFFHKYTCFCTIVGILIFNSLIRTTSKRLKSIIASQNTPGITRCVVQYADLVLFVIVLRYICPFLFDNHLAEEEKNVAAYSPFI